MNNDNVLMLDFAEDYCPLDESIKGHSRREEWENSFLTMGACDEY